MKIIDWLLGKRTWYLYEPNGWSFKDAIFVRTMFGTEKEAQKTGLLYSSQTISKNPDNK